MRRRLPSRTISRVAFLTVLDPFVCTLPPTARFTLSGDCPRCAFDLYRGDLIANDPGFEDLPRVACPTCSTTYSMVSGKHGPPIKRSGLAGFVGGLAKTATTNDAGKNAEAFQITIDEDDGRVYCRLKRSGNSR